MSIKLLSAFLLLISSNCLSQVSNPKLDLHRSFKEIKLGDAKQTWLPYLTFGENKENVSLYQFDTRKCCSTIFDAAVEALFVYIKEDRVVGIEINPFKIQKGSIYGETTKIDVGYAKFDNFVSHFATLFGEPMHIGINDGDKIAKWLGDSTYLQLEYKYYGVLNGDRLQIQIWDRKHLESSLSKGF